VPLFSANVTMQQRSKQTAPSYKVVVVEDEGLIAHDIASRLEALGHEVVGTASTAEEAVAQSGGADVVLMDIHIDGPRDGIDAAREIRARHHIPVVFLTAHADRATLDRAKVAGPFGYLMKPVVAAALQTSLELAVHKHRVERALEKREAWLRATLACAAEAIVVADPSGQIRALNRAAEALTGWSDAEAQGRRLESIVRLVEEESGQDAGDPAPLAILKGAPMALDRGLRLVSREGRELAVEGTVAPVLSPDPPETLGVVLTLRDVSARRWEERQLRQAQRMEAAARLAARVSGEYAGLLEIIRLQTARLLQQFGEYSSAREALEEIDQAAEAAHRITQHLAEFGGRQVAQPEILSPNAILRRMARLIESTAGAGIVTIVRPGPAAGRVKADAAQIEQATMNLVLHACAAMPQGGKLLLETSRAEAPSQRPGMSSHLASYVAIALEYSATEPDLENLFDPAGAGQGGLALPVAHSIAAEHGGYLSARSTPEGTRIEMLLPRVQEELLTAPALNTDQQAGAILLLDQRDHVRSQLHNFFESAGYNLLEACDRDEAIALAEMLEGGLDLLIAEPADADAILADMRALHPAMESLRVVDGPETSPLEIRRPFTQQAMLERVEALLCTDVPTSSSPAASAQAS
jgi:two-component system cell cycle sensor histidine kinase/response regulator CckA